MDRSWWPDCLAFALTRPDSARLLPVGPHEELGLRDPCGFRGRPAGTGYAEVDVGLQGTSDREYENTVRT